MVVAALGFEAVSLHLDGWMVHDGSPLTAKRTLVTQKDGVFKNKSGSTKEYLMNTFSFVDRIEENSLLVKAEGCR